MFYETPFGSTAAREEAPPQPLKFGVCPKNGSNSMKGKANYDERPSEKPSEKPRKMLSEVAQNLVHELVCVEMTTLFVYSNFSPSKCSNDFGMKLKKKKP